jgi:uncharacterized protein
VLDEVVSLLEIQRLDKMLGRLDEKLAEIPLGVQAVQADLQKKRARLEAALARISEAEKRKRKIEQDIEDSKARAQKLDGQLMSVKTNTEYRAMLTQIQAIKDQSSDRETEILLILEQADELQAERRLAEDEFKSFEATAHTQIGEREKFAADLGKERQMALERRAELTGKLEKKLVTLYERLRKKMPLPVVVELHGEICQGCHLSLRPQHAVYIKQAKELYSCEYCHRILYFPDKPPEAEPAEEAAES